MAPVLCDVGCRFWIYFNDSDFMRSDLHWDQLSEVT
jgi:hypothetical protein